MGVNFMLKNYENYARFMHGISMNAKHFIAERSQIDKR